VSIEDDIAFLERVPTLRLLGRTALRILAIGAESRYIHDGETLFTAGESADCGYVVQEGSFDLHTDPAAEIVIGPGALLGELALIAATQRPATAVAREPSTVLRISRSLFLKMLDGYPDAAVKLREQIAARADGSMRDLRNVRAVLDSSEAPRDAAKAQRPKNDNALR
jgi:CRP-like cAMP-binding protein